MGTDPDSTRQKLLDSAYQQIHLNGFQATSLTMILEGTGCTKGALYHHFKNKNEIGYAVVDEIVSGEIQDFWLKPLSLSIDPVATIQEIIMGLRAELDPEIMSNGCPLNNLIQEMSSIDPVFREKLGRIMGNWQRALAEAIERGIAHGTVRKDANPWATAQFIIVVIEGITSILKSGSSMEVSDLSAGEFFRYLQSLKA